jgi:hypothetical protein
MDIKVSATTGDIELSEAGDLQWITGGEAIAQHARIRVREVLGEWFLDEREGFPYWEDVLVHHPNVTAITEAYRRTIAETPGMASVDRCELTFDRQTRTLTPDIEATTSDGTLLTADDFPPFVLR